MSTLNLILKFLHFVGLTLGFATSFANMAMAGLIEKAAPPEKAVLGRFPPVMSRIGRIGLGLLWITGLTLVFTKYGGFEGLPTRFYFKLTAVVLLTVVVTYIHGLERRIARGDLAATARIQSAGKISAALALIALIFAVATFG